MSNPQFPRTETSASLNMDVYIDNPITKLSLYYSKLIYASWKNLINWHLQESITPLTKQATTKKSTIRTLSLFTQSNADLSHSNLISTTFWGDHVAQRNMSSNCWQLGKHTHFQRCSIANCLQLIDPTSASMKLAVPSWSRMCSGGLIEHNICTLPRTLVAPIRGVFCRPEHPRRDIPRRDSAELMTRGK
jgi:hypothetical protein